MHVNGSYENFWNLKQNNLCVTPDSELFRCQPVLFVSLRIVSYLGVSLCSLMPSAATVGGIGELAYALMVAIIYRFFYKLAALLCLSLMLSLMETLLCP